jgi:hypothetical protein
LFHLADANLHSVYALILALLIPRHQIDAVRIVVTASVNEWFSTLAFINSPPFGSWHMLKDAKKKSAVVRLPA